MAPTAGFLALRDSSGFQGAIPLPKPIAAVPDDHFLIRFQPGRAEPPAGLTDAPVAAFTFSSIDLRDSLLSVGVLRLERLLPSFHHEDVHSTNLLGEPILLEDLADLYVAHVAPGIDARTVAQTVSHWCAPALLGIK